MKYGLLFFLAVLLTQCRRAEEPAPRRANFGERFILQANDSVRIAYDNRLTLRREELTIRLLSLKDDRCRVNSSCLVNGVLRAGQATVVVQLATNQAVSAPQTMTKPGGVYSGTEVFQGGFYIRLTVRVGQQTFYVEFHEVNPYPGTLSNVVRHAVFIVRQP